MNLALKHYRLMENVIGEAYELAFDLNNGNSHNAQLKRLNKAMKALTECEDKKIECLFAHEEALFRKNTKEKKHHKPNFSGKTKHKHRNVTDKGKRKTKKGQSKTRTQKHNTARNQNTKHARKHKH